MTLIRRLEEKNLSWFIFDTVTKGLIDRFGIDTDIQRIDSIHIKSFMKSLSRLGLLSATVMNFLKALSHADDRPIDRLPAELLERYLKDGDHGDNYFGQIKSPGRQRALDGVAQDMHGLLTWFGPDPAISGMDEFKLMALVFDRAVPRHRIFRGDPPRVRHR
ncbi:MAG: hypothetical protein LBL95_03550 [Deltaproteobacteria bacterium]|jgi:hypothetical protein|nr:hypothetical protein [Deltaproteobacteria bacterium]